MVVAGGVRSSFRLQGREGLLYTLGGQVGEARGRHPPCQVRFGAGGVGPFHVLRLDFRQVGALDQRHDAGGADGEQLGVLGRSPSGAQDFDPGGQMDAQRRGLMVAVRFGLGIHDPLAAEQHAVLEVAG
jgi:hypothetical protein